MPTTSHSDCHSYGTLAADNQAARTLDEASLRLAPYLSMALQTLCDHELEVEDRQRLILIVRAALEGRSHFFAAALHDPDQEELDQFFTDFVIRCVQRPQEGR